MEIPFVIKGVAGRVVVSYEPNLQPDSVGCRPETRGFPVCSATVERPLRGYDSLMGWVQPSRSTRADLEWTARSFLCVPDDLGNGLEAHAVLGFEWGFVIDGGEITLEPPRRLGPHAWDEVLPVLRAEHEGWGFPAGFPDLSAGARRVRAAGRV
jgi:hypothetical protein